MKCHACAHVNADNALFCAACRRPLVAPTRATPRLEPLAASAASSGAAPGGSFGGADAGASRNRFAPPRDADADAEHADDASRLLTDEEAWGAVIGNSNTRYYLERFERLTNGDSAGWHWPAALVTWYWMLYRKLWIPALIYFFAPIVLLVVLAAVLRSAPLLVIGLWLAAVIGIPGMKANDWYFKQCEKKIDNVRARGGSKTQMIARLEAEGGTSGVAILVAILLIFFGSGILAAIALPAYQTYTVKAKVAEAMIVGNQVAAVVGKQYEQTGVLPSGGDFDRIAGDAARQARFVSGASIDSSTAAITIKVEVPPNITGSFVLSPSDEGNRHLRWTCSADDDLAKYAPRSCRAH